MHSQIALEPRFIRNMSKVWLVIVGPHTAQRPREILYSFASRAITEWVAKLGQGYQLTMLSVLPSRVMYQTPIIV